MSVALEVRSQVNSQEKGNEFLEIAVLQAEFNRALNLKDDPNFSLKRSYNPVIDRWHIEKLRKIGDVKGLLGFRAEMRKNWDTNLMERLHAVESYGEFAIKDGELYSNDFPEEPFSQILKRGVDYRHRLGSYETEREGELGELAGWAIINSVGADPKTPIETTVYSLSPHGLAKDTVYDGWFVDKFTVKENALGKRYVERARTAVDWDYKDYRKAAISLDDNFFAGYDGRSEDAWFLSHPVVRSEDNLEVVQKGMSSIDFLNIYEDYRLRLFIDHYEEEVSREVIDWVEVAYAFNAILNHADDLKKGSSVVEKSSREDVYVAFLASVRTMGQRPVETVGGGGCPPNSGINMGISTGPSILSNSVAKFGIETGKKILCCTCPVCEREVEAIISNGKISCPECSASADWSETVSGE